MAGRPIVDTYWIKQDDTLPSIEATLLDGDGNAIDIFGTAVNFRMRLQDTTGPAKVNAAATVLDDGTEELRGRVLYAWAAGDTDTGGDYDADWHVVSGGQGLTVPNPGHLTIHITESLNT